MHITHLSLENFRNYGRLELNFPLGATLLHGENAQGKTNLLEALTYLATTRSPHAGQDSQMLNWDMVSSPDPVIVGRLTAAIATKEGIRRVQMRLIREQKERGQVSFRREALINGRKVRLMDMLGQLQVVLFLPEDVNLITGAPNMRRRYLNVMLCQIDRHYCRNLSQYNKVLEQRNATLRRLAEGQDNPEILAIFSERLVELGSQIYARRAAFFAEISRDTQRIHYEELTGGRESLRIGYLPRLQVGQNGNDKETAVALAGWLDEHRGDLETVSQRFAGELASSYEADIARGALAMKMAEIEWMSRLSGETPILLLDEVLAELDQQRRELLLRTVQSVEQAILTATDPGMFSSDFLEKATSMTVSGGRVQVDSSS
jgi:DNA replication and repair protein RecF